MYNAKERKHGFATMLVAGMLWLFALACSQSPTAPAADENTGFVKNGGPQLATADTDSTPLGPP